MAHPLGNSFNDIWMHQIMLNELVELGNLGNIRLAW